jgi:hypothetical protein
VGPSLVVETDPVADHTAGVLQTLEAVAMYALFFESTDHTFDHPVLLRVVWRDEFLPQTVTLDQGGEPVIPPISIGVRSRTFTRPWPAAA